MELNGIQKRIENVILKNACKLEDEISYSFEIVFDYGNDDIDIFIEYLTKKYDGLSIYNEDGEYIVVSNR